jgi:hypothetical protein
MAGKVIAAVPLTEDEVVELEVILQDQDGAAALRFLAQAVYQKFIEGKKEREWHVTALDQAAQGKTLPSANAS